MNSRENKVVVIVGLGAIGNKTSKKISKYNHKLILIDRDIVEEKNLSYQKLYSNEDIGKSKAVVANEKIKNTEAYGVDLTFENINLLEKADIVLDCTDNFETRFLINEYCVKNKIPWVYSAGIKDKGTVMSIIPNKACFRCVFNDSQTYETCETEGILDKTIEKVSNLQTELALKILNKGELEQAMIRINIPNNKTDIIKVNKREDCPVCNGRYDFLEGEKGNKAVKLCGGDSYQIKGNFDFESLKEKYKGKSDFFLKINNQVSIFKDGRAIIKSKDKKEARSLYSKFIGN